MPTINIKKEYGAKGVSSRFESSKSRTDEKDEFDDEDFDEVPYNDKLNLSQSIKLLTQEQLGEIVKLISEEATKAYKEVERDKVQVVVDEIPLETFNKIQK